MRCKQCEDYIVEMLYGELDPATSDQVNAHVGECEACARFLSEARATIKTMNQREHVAPGEEFWDGYFDRLQERMAAEGVDVEDSSQQSWWRRRVGGGGTVASWGYRVAAAAAILVVGIVAGRTFLAPTPDQFPQPVAVDTTRSEQAGAPQNVAENSAGTETERTPVPTADVAIDSDDVHGGGNNRDNIATAPRPSGGDVALASSGNPRAMRYVEKSQMLLLAVVNTDPAADGYTASMAGNKRRSMDLIDEARVLKEELSDPKERRLRELVIQLEKILREIANLEDEGDIEAVEFIRGRVNSHDVMLKINLEQMRQGDEVGGQGSGDTGASQKSEDMKGSI